jgi:Acyl-CoA reductase (LuxC)
MRTELMKDIHIENRIIHLSKLGEALAHSNSLDNEVYQRARAANPWFISSFIQYAVDAVVKEYLNETKLRLWVESYPELAAQRNSCVGLILAGNIPLVGMHDIICLYISGMKGQIKVSSKDDILSIWILEQLFEFDPEAKERMILVDRWKEIDAAIATGGDNSFRYFEYYFRNMPHLLRHNRNSIAVLKGDESEAELSLLADDIFLFFGLGCRSVSKIYIPKHYDIRALFPAVEAYRFFFDHQKYKNNYDYNRTLLLLNSVPHLANEFLNVKEDKSFASPLSLLHYETYEDIEVLEAELLAMRDSWQCAVSKLSSDKINYVALGTSQKPSLNSYADDKDTLSFLCSLS